MGKGRQGPASTTRMGPRAAPGIRVQRDRGKLWLFIFGEFRGQIYQKELGLSVVKEENESNTAILWGLWGVESGTHRRQEVVLEGHGCCRTLGGRATRQGVYNPPSGKAMWWVRRRDGTTWSLDVTLATIHRQNKSQDPRLPRLKLDDIGHGRAQGN